MENKNNNLSGKVIAEDKMKETHANMCWFTNVTDTTAKPLTKELFGKMYDAEFLLDECVLHNGTTLRTIGDVLKAIAPMAEKYHTMAKNHQESSREAQQLHNSIGTLKKKLPAVAFQVAAFEGNRRTQAGAVGNGLVLLDFDHLDNPRASWQWVQEAGSALIGEMCVFAAITPSCHGLRLVMKGVEQVSYKDNLQTYWKTFAQHGLDPDKACKDVSRLSFAVSRDYVLHISNDLFAYRCKLPDKTPQADNGAVATSTTSSSTTPAPHTSGERYTKGLAATMQPEEVEKLCEKVMLKQNDGAWPQTGDRNNTLFKTACVVRYLVDNDISETRRLIDHLADCLPSHYDKQRNRNVAKTVCGYTRYESLPRTLSEAVDEMGITLHTRTLDYAPYYERLQNIALPEPIAATLRIYPDKQKAAILPALFPIMGELLHGVTYIDHEGKADKTVFQVFVEGEPGTGKSFINQIGDLWLKPVREADQKSHLRMNAYKEECERANGETKPQRPRCIRYRVESRSSTSALQSVICDNYDTTTHSTTPILIMEAEAATMVQSYQSQLTMIKDFLLKGFAGEETGQNYKTYDSPTGFYPTYINLLLGGTPAARRSLIDDGSGMLQRVMVLPLYSNAYDVRRPFCNKRSTAETDLVCKTAEQMFGLNNASPILCRNMVMAMHQWLQEIVKEAQAEGNERMARMARRPMLMGLRTGIVFSIIEQLDRIAEVEATDDPDMGKVVVMEASDNAIEMARLMADMAMETLELYASDSDSAHQQRNNVRAAFEHESADFNARVYKQFGTRPFTLQELQELFATTTKGNLKKLMNRGVTQGAYCTTGGNCYQVKQAGCMAQ